MGEDKVKEIIEDNIYENIEGALLKEEVEISEEVIMEDFFEITKASYDVFNDYCYNKGDGYKAPSFESLGEKLEGIESGMYVFAGESNSGKSAVMMNMMKDIASCPENNLFGIYYSLDDSKNEIIPRIIAMEMQIPIAVAGKPKRFENLIEQIDDSNGALYEEYLIKREQGINKLKDDSSVFMIEDSMKIKNSTDLKNHISMVQTYVKSIDPNKNLIIAIDALNDIHLDKNAFGRIADNEKDGEVAKFTKNLAIEFDIPVFVSCHLRKLNGNRRPTLDDLRNANTLVYEASVVFLVFNDVSKNKGIAKIYWEDTQSESNLGAIIEIDWAKNKKSSFKGRTFYKFKPHMSKIIECGKEDSRRYEALIIQG